MAKAPRKVAAKASKASAKAGAKKKASAKRTKPPVEDRASGIKQNAASLSERREKAMAEAIQKASRDGVTDQKEIHAAMMRAHDAIKE